MRSRAEALPILLVGLCLLSSAVQAAGNDAVQAASNKTCFEFPVVIVAPTVEALPAKGCREPDLPNRGCMKRIVEAELRVIDHEHGIPNCLHDVPTATHLAFVHYRGQSSLGFKKHQFAVKLHEESTFLGFPTDRTFILNGPMIDGSLIRNDLAHWMFRETGRYSPRTRQIVVFLQNLGVDTPDYRGIYLALEKIGYGPNRVGLANLNPNCSRAEFSGGWAWQYNPLSFGTYSPNLALDPYQLMFGGGERPVLMYPKAKALTKSMRDYFVSRRTGPLPLLFRHLYHNISYPDQLEEHIDMGSFVDYLLHTELSQNIDAYRRSAYFFKDRDQPVSAGPVWDFNLAYGLGSNAKDWMFKSQMLWRRLLCNYKFVALTIQRWRALRANVWSDNAIHHFINGATNPIFRQLKNCEDWRKQDLQCAFVKAHGNYEDHVQNLRDAVLARAQWIDENIVKLYGVHDNAMWNPAPACPVNNCARDANDSGCLVDPDKYVNAVTFPPLRTPYKGPECKYESLPSDLRSENVTIDPCWLAAGVYLNDASITPFCSGNGQCPPGPNATCECVRGHQPPDCGHLNVDVPIMTRNTSTESDRQVDDVGNDEPERAALQAPSASASTSASTATPAWAAVLVVLAGLGVVVAVTRAFRRRAPQESHPMLESTGPTYGTS